MADQHKKLANLTLKWFTAHQALLDVESEMSEPYQVLMSEARTLDGLQTIADILPKTCRITRRVYETMIRMQDEKLDGAK